MMERIEKIIFYSFHHGLRYTNTSSLTVASESAFSASGRVLAPGGAC